MSAAVIVSGARTPAGRLLGSLKEFTAMDLGGTAIKVALERGNLRRPGRLRDHGPGAPGRGRAETFQAGGGQGDALLPRVPGPAGPHDG
jgi:acetyl-CoA acetyltransferase